MVNAAVTLTQSGMKYQELASETGALYSVGALASIGKVSTVEAAEAISAGANIFGAKGDELGKMADFMQKVGTTTPLHIGLQATALREGGPEAKMLGLTYKEAFTAMGAYAKQTGDAAKAGERLMEFGHRLSGATAKEKEALEEAGPSFYDRRGKRKPFLQIIQELQRFRADLESKHPTFTEEEFNDLFKKIFEGRGEFMAFALSKRGEGSYQDVAAEAEKSYSIQEKVNIATRDFGRNVEALLGSTKTLVADAFDPLLKSLTPLVKQINDVIGALDSFAKEHRELTKDVTKGVVALMAFGAVWGSIRIVQGIISFTRVLGAFATGARVAAAAAAPLEAGVAAIATGATAAASAVASLVTALGALTWWMHSSVMEHYEKTGELPPSPNDPLDSSIQWEDPDAALIKQALRKDKGQVGGNMSSALPHPEHSYSEQMSRFVESLKVHPQVNITQNISIDQNGRVTSSTSDPDAKTTINLKRGRFMPTSFSSTTEEGRKGDLQMHSMSRFTMQTLIVIACLLCAVQSWARDMGEEIRNAPIEQQLAFLNAPNSSWTRLDPLVVARFKSLLDQLTQKYFEDRALIANWTVKIQGALEHYGINETPLNMMEGINGLSGGSGSKSYKDSLTAYATLRNEKGKSHKEALAALPAYIKHLQANGTIKQ